MLLKVAAGKQCTFRTSSIPAREFGMIDVKGFYSIFLRFQTSTMSFWLCTPPDTVNIVMVAQKILETCNRM